MKNVYNWAILGWSKYEWIFIYRINWDSIDWSSIYYGIFFNAHMKFDFMCKAKYTVPNLPYPNGLSILKSDSFTFYTY